MYIGTYRVAKTIHGKRYFAILTKNVLGNIISDFVRKSPSHTVRISNIYIHTYVLPHHC
jgi:hypothetical protein